MFVAPLAQYVYTIQYLHVHEVKACELCGTAQRVQLHGRVDQPPRQPSQLQAAQRGQPRSSALDNATTLVQCRMSV